MPSVLDVFSAGSVGTDAAVAADSGDMNPGKTYVQLSWDVVVQIRAGLLPPPYPEDFNGPGFEPSAPTMAKPGSPAKITVMAERYVRRERLFCLRDAVR